MVAQIDRLRAVPIVRRHRVDGVALVIGGVVDQHAGRAEPGPGLADRRAQRRDVGDVAGQEQRLVRGAGKLRWRAPRRQRCDVEKRHLAPWAAKARTMSAPMPEAPPVITTTAARLG